MRVTAALFLSNHSDSCSISVQSELIERLRCLHARGTRPDEVGSGQVGSEPADSGQHDLSAGCQYEVISDDGVIITVPAGSTTVASAYNLCFYFLYSYFC